MLRFLSDTPVRSNIALGKKAAQSASPYDEIYGAAKAVDGNTDGNIDHGSCSHTKNYAYNQIVPWWRVDLAAASYVDSVTLYNRLDCCCK